MNNEYITQDLGIAAFLLAAGCEMLRIDHLATRSWFVFDGKARAKSDEYYQNNLNVNARLMADALRSLKSKLREGK